VTWILATNQVIKLNLSLMTWLVVLKPKLQISQIAKHKSQNPILKVHNWGICDSQKKCKPLEASNFFDFQKTKT